MKALTLIKDFNVGLPIQDIAYLFSDRGRLCFLDSSLIPDKFSKYSYLCWDPVARLSSTGYRNTINNFQKEIEVISYQHPLTFFKNYIACSTFRHGLGEQGHRKIYMDEKNSQKSIKEPPDFLGGFIGYLSYDLKDFIEVLPCTIDDDIGMPLLDFYLFDWVIAFCHDEEKYYYIKNYFYCPGEKKGRPNLLETLIDKDSLIFKKDLDDTLHVANDSLDLEINKRIQDIKSTAESFHKKNGHDSVKKYIVDKYLQKDIRDVSLISNFKKSEYIEAIKKAKEYIHQGEIYQMNMTQRFMIEKKIDAEDLYYILREKNSAPFSAFLDFGSFKVLGSSPERFLLLDKDIIETRPIKGTRPRGRDKTEDAVYEKELENSIKDRAELNMIVDLERNDLGKFCDYGTVEVAEHAVIEKYAKVFHSVSTVRGRVRKGYDISDIIKATFPGGSITGAPKIRAMQIIDELETRKRNIYTGSIGYIGIDNTMDINIVIRTFIVKDDTYFYDVGGGIVEDSVPEEEYRETLDKGIALKNSLEFFEFDNLKKDKD